MPFPRWTAPWTARRSGSLVAGVATVAAAVVAASTVAAAPPAGTAAPERPRGADCYAEGGPLTVEEQRLGLPLPGEDTEAASRRFIEAAGFDRLVDRFQRRLCLTRRLDIATGIVDQYGADLWRTAVDRAQGRTQIGTIDRYDDRPLYWARTTMARALREWQPPFELSSLQRQALIRGLSYSSRGIDSVSFPEGDDVTRVLVSGFDTYSLDSSLRNSNPSGASALQLDGRTVETADGPVVVQAVVLPVNWSDFDQGIVEDAFGPWLVGGTPDGGPQDPAGPPPDQRADMIMTISQTGRGRMDVEQWAGGFRGGFPDNNRAIQYGPISAAALWPQPQPSPQWIETTLPYQAMVDAGTGPWPVVLHDGIIEWPAGTYPDPGSLRSAADPSPGSRAASAPGGNYLSNESMYRTNRLRLGAGLDELPGGHLHISSLVYPDDLNVLTSPAFEADRQAVVDQTVALVEAAGTAVAGSGS
ncbi:hypothetical protein [uncultured Pseudokineococcus sp.]|uniref:hypothetical protein n=1 Tax=uncultured Pseudokineococcus sp. TaxID=1642928 RepID=UPI00262BFC89|nr:hypothetical protein [uncultured Pseudokineococcus sp.]